MLKALKVSLGIVTAAAKQVKLSRDVHYAWLRADPIYAAKVREVEDIQLDYSESQLFVAMQKGNIAAIIFHLKCKGKRRGYIERMEVGGAGGGAIPISGKMTIEDAKEEVPPQALPAIFEALKADIGPVDFKKQPNAHRTSNPAKPAGHAISEGDHVSEPEGEK